MLCRSSPVLPGPGGCRLALAVTALALAALGSQATWAAGAVRAACELHPTTGELPSDAHDGRTLTLDAQRPAALANWEVRWWQKHRLWIALSATNHASTVARLLPEIVVDARTAGGAAAVRRGLPIVLAPGASATQRLSVWIPADAKTLGVRTLSLGPAPDLALNFALECSEARFDKGEMAVPAAALFDEAMRLYFGNFVDPLQSSRDYLELVQGLASGAQDGADVAWVLRGLMQVVGDEAGFVRAPGEAPPPAAAPLPTRAPEFEWRADGVAVLRLGATGFESDGQALAWAGALHDGIEALAARRPRAWIVDLRQHQGVDPWPSLAGLSTLLAGPEVGADVTRAGRRAWIVERGAARLAGAAARIDLQSPPEPAFHGPIGVLIGPNTMNVGGSVAVAFQGRPHTRFFGLPSANSAAAGVHEHRLADGTVVGILDTRPADRMGRIAPSTLEPDERLEAPGSPDGVPLAALQWALAETAAR